MEKVTNDIINIGVNDYNITLFENQYILEKGMAYNSYLIMDDKIVIMDTVDKGVTDKWLENLDTALAGREADYLVVQHMEPDHSGSLTVAVERFPQMKILASAQALNMIKQFTGLDMSDRTIVIKEGDTLELGSHTLNFMAAPMVHWPEVTVTYESKEKVLFSADGFGKFGTTDADEDWTCEARRYYFNICGKYGMQVQNLLKKVGKLDIGIICSLHGPVLTENLEYYIGKYNTWSSYEPENKGIFIAYASIYGNTALAAEKLKEMIESKSDIKVSMADLCRDDMAEAVEDAFRYDRLVLAAATYDAGVFPAMENFLHHLKAKNYQKRAVAFVENGSWAPMAGKAMKSIVEGYKDITVVEPMVTIKSSLNDDSMKQLECLADELIHI